MSPRRVRTAECWAVLQAEEQEPNPALVARARELVADFDTFERRMNDYLSQMAKECQAAIAETGSG